MFLFVCFYSREAIAAHCFTMLDTDSPRPLFFCYFFFNPSAQCATRNAPRRRKIIIIPSQTIVTPFQRLRAESRVRKTKQKNLMGMDHGDIIYIILCLRYCGIQFYINLIFLRFIVVLCFKNKICFWKYEKNQILFIYN